MFNKLRNLIVEQWYRFQIGLSFLTLINFSLLVITAGDKIQTVIPFRIIDLIIILIPLAFFGTWFIGFIMERYIKFPQQQEREVVKRSPIWNLTHEKLDSIESKLDKVIRNEK